jgi:hypothetical protein
MVAGRSDAFASWTMRCCICAFNEPEIGLVCLRTTGEIDNVLAVDRDARRAARSMVGARNHPAAWRACCAGLI